MLRGSSSNHTRGRRLCPAPLAFVLIAAFAASAVAQHVVTEPPRVGSPPTPLPSGGSSGVGGGAGLLSPTLPMPGLPSVAAPPAAAPPVAAPAAPVPAAPRIVRFRCEVAPQDQSCREPGAPDGGGDDSECSCARDYCHTTPAGTRECEKLQ